MYNGLITVCDSCGKILDGRDRTAIVNKDYILFKGNIGQYVSSDPIHNGEPYMYWLKRRDDYTELHFCNFEHLSDFMSAKIALVRMTLQTKNNWDGETLPE